MLSWASEKFSALSEAVAPPPTDTKHRFSTSLTRGDEQGALSCLTDHTDPLSPHEVLDVRRGTQPIHAAAGASSITVLRALISQYGCQPELFDYGGNTPLHYAATTSLRSNPAQAKQCVQTLIDEFGANPTVKNSQGQTPYDVATMDSIRQYLLPIQLQRETQEAIDRGGYELPPGIDMGGMTISKAHLAPPPVMAMPGGAAGGGAGAGGAGAGANGGAVGGVNQFRNAGGPAYAAPPTPGQMQQTPGQAPSAADALMSPPPMGFTSAQQAQGASVVPPASPAVPASPASPVAPAQPFSPPAPSVGAAAAPGSGASGSGGAAGAAPFATPQPPTPVNNAAAATASPAPAAPPAPAQGSAPASNASSTAAATPAAAAPVSAASSSSGYARSGFSSAAVLPKQSKYRPDGFHSSSSDVTLQAKYGHTHSAAPGRDPGMMAAVAPPPTSSGGGPNPFASGGGAGAGGVGRYPTYCAVTGAVGSVGGPASGGVPASTAAAATPMPTFNPYIFGGAAAPNGNNTPSPAATAPAQVAPSSTPSPAAAMTTPQPSPAPVAAPAASALPEGWAEYSDQTTGKPYYYNASTGTTSWERPEAAPTNTAADTPAPASAESAPASGTAEASTPAASTTVDKLKEGWVEVSDPSSGKPYYYNSATQETSWDKPVEQVPVAEEPKQESEPAVAEPAVAEPAVAEPAVVEPEAEPVKDVKEESPSTAEEAIVDDIPIEELPAEAEDKPEMEPVDDIQVREADAKPEVTESEAPAESEAEVAPPAEAPVDETPKEEPSAEEVVTEKTSEPPTSENVNATDEASQETEVVAEPEPTEDALTEEPVAISAADEAPETEDVALENDTSASAPASSEAPSSDAAAPVEEEALPEGWAEAQDPTGKTYYYNSSSGETSWNRPAAGKLKTASPAESAETALPEGWAETTDPSGKTYYYNGATGETSWERPAAVKEEAATPAASVPATPQTNGTASTASAADIFSSPPSGGAPPIMPTVGDAPETAATAAPSAFGGLPPPPVMSLGD